MPPSAEPALRDAVAGELRTLESLTAEAGRGLGKKDWIAVEAAIAKSRRAMHALANAFDAAAAERDAEFDALVFGRLRELGLVRDRQMETLRQYRDSVGARLQLLGRAKTAMRGFSAPAHRRSSLGRLDQTR